VYILAYIRRVLKKTAKIFRSGNSQAVRIPKEFQLEGSKVEIVKKGVLSGASPLQEVLGAALRQPK
jgi:hypothetical protein